MARLLWVLFVLQITISSIYGSFNRYPKIELGPRDDGYAGKPLFLTPFIESGTIAEGRRLARVPFTDRFKVKSYAGFFTVNKEWNSNQFFWYFPAMVGKNAPIIVWLQGGPGASSLYGLFMENGPLRVRDGKFERRKFTWSVNHHVIYIDNPVGTGFSFTNNSIGYCRNETQVGEQLYSTVTQFLKLFPELQQNKFYVTGESYGGKYVPALAYTIHKKNPTADLKINLQGVAIGNGLSDPNHQLLYSKYLYQLGLIDWNQANTFQKYESQAVRYIQNGQWDAAYETFDSLLNGDMIQGKSIFYNMTGFDFYFNYLHTKDYHAKEDFGPLLQKSSIRKDIHVGDLEFHNGSLVEKHLKQDVMQSVAPWVSELIEHYSVVIYNGQLDIIVAYPLTVNYLRNLNFTGAEAYKTAKRYIWKVDGDVAGYVKEAGHLVEIMVRNAGHMVPADQPHWALDMITRLTHGKSFTMHSKKLRHQKYYNHNNL